MTDLIPYPLLNTIKSPDDLTDLDKDQLILLAAELRLFLLQTLDKTGGHLSSNLGAVELTIALHRTFNTPEDKIIWDVGHQAYPHKILTGRAQQLDTIRLKNGLSGFPKRSESPYDAFGVGHSSTSISAALGMAIAAKKADLKQKSIAVIGDGAMTAGMAFEALNHAGDLDADLLVILNDNDMSISPNVGGLSNYFAKVLSGKLYTTVKSNSKKVLSSMPSVWELACRAEEHMKGMVIPGTLFEELGFNYIGPVDGHDLPTLLATLKNIKELSGPQFLHIVTQKGKGFETAEQQPTQYHSASPGFYSNPPDSSVKPETTPTYTQVFSEWIIDAAHKNQQLIGITPAMREGSGLVEFSEQFADRYYDVGIAEQHSVTLAAGMACEGLKPVVAIYSSFLQRAYDQLIHDVALQNLPVLFAIDRSGIVGSDGATHTGNFDLSFMRCIPNMTIMAPADENECYHMLNYGFALNSPVAVRYPRGKGPGKAIDKQTPIQLEIGKGELVFDNDKEKTRHKTNKTVTLLSFGSLLHEALSAADELTNDYHIKVVNMRFIKPLDTNITQQLAQTSDLLITLEDNSVLGGAGSAVNESLISEPSICPVINLGLPDKFPEHATQQEIHHSYGLDCSGLVKTIQNKLA
ncbi:MAG: 1-deoxy-D-xylulose-5-phosphate synthase [gamma proteobacterium symbiont of Bathyaustriella thionipta]|nr:1-deoxy-D-xylulose-5-phosphate synthase [gamma proteobacterium symbiont of Bathyaustriella thionipta]MCU7948640.1 1-deoxy-D-xylulose-5-phosphate synthase [gamma proteobacterium symbiont of Bathyaustriella thionipta]MCU7953046.1 1-deoxy-D-xylulose-5-phosphate synthase [gamma proteobacterium symbiont of Bathyaustriella thionipta]MCU7955354.1 1-deoxy-D-xylulose-5-phosphate synthase [gamma proteobacterium symbiont of Bathyaustriella thionipta]MCU7967520.1 1-deoxy-D-xylulose-5-phosphate synthase 